MADGLDFTFELLPLSTKEPVSLSEAMQFLRYGAVLKVRYAGTIPSEQIEGGYLSIAADGHYVLHPLYSDARLKGPHVLDIAKEGGALFGVAKDDSPDPEALENAKARHGLRLARHDAAKRDFAENTARRADAVELHRQWQVLSAEFAQQFRSWESGGKVGAKPECPEEPAIPNEPMPPTPPAALDTTCLPKAWQAEKERREAALQAHLNDAARSGKLRILGVQVDDPLCLKPSPPTRQPCQISADYFSISRDFDSDYERIHFVDSDDSAATEDYLLSSLAGETLHSYSNVCVKREDLLALAAEIAPELVRDEDNKTQQTYPLDVITTSDALAAPRGGVKPADVEDVLISARPRGRPSSMPLIEDELRRRAATGEIQKSVKEEGAYLSKWLEKTHPASPRMRPKSVSDKIGGAKGLHTALLRSMR